LALKSASIALAGAGLLIALLGLQNLTLIHWTGSYVMVPAALLGLGVAGIGVAAKLVRGRAWTLAAALACSGLLAFAATGFFVLSVMSGLFTLLTLMGLGAGVTAAVLTVLAIGPFRRLIDTRRKLRDHGYDLDL